MVLRSFPFRVLSAILLVAGGLGACNPPQMSATAPLTGLRPEAATLSIRGISGPSDEQGQRFATILAQEARQRGFVLAEADAPLASTQLRAYLDPFTGADGQPAIAYVLQTSADGRNRANRVAGLVPVGSAGWPGLDDRAMRQVAAASLEDLARQLAGQAGEGDP